MSSKCQGIPPDGPFPQQTFCRGTAVLQKCHDFSFANLRSSRLFLMPSCHSLSAHSQFPA